MQGARSVRPAQIEEEIRRVCAFVRCVSGDLQPFPPQLVSPWQARQQQLQDFMVRPFGV